MLATAYLRGLDTESTWLPNVPSRQAHSGLPRTSTGLLWPDKLRHDVERRFELLDCEAHTIWSDSFVLTRSNYVLTAIEHGLADIQNWIHEVPGDRRFT